jgi:hypothetical protein
MNSRENVSDQLISDEISLTRAFEYTCLCWFSSAILYSWCSTADENRVEKRKDACFFSIGDIAGEDRARCSDAALLLIEFRHSGPALQLGCEDCSLLVPLD